MSMEGGWDLDFPGDDDNAEGWPIGEPDAASLDNFEIPVVKDRRTGITFSDDCEFGCMPTDHEPSDREKLTTLLDSWGVPWIVERFDRNCILVGVSDIGSLPFVDSDKVGGYSGFYTSFGFNDDGSFDQMGAYE